jgi:SNF2 family DNA or RNA helicase
MIDQNLLSSLQNRGLKAWQASFVASFLADEAAPFQLLASPPGAGKTLTGVAIVAELAKETAKRILILPPTSLCYVWLQQLRRGQSQMPVDFVTRQVFREIEADVPIGQSPWTYNRVYVVSQDLAKQPDFASSLASIVWDLVIVDEAHRCASPQRSALINKMMTASAVSRLLLMTATPLPFLSQWINPLPERQSPFSIPLVLTSWYGTLRNWDGSEINRIQVEWEEVSYKRGADEVMFLSKLKSMLSTKKITTPVDKFWSNLLMQRAYSSLFAIEQSLQRLGLKIRSFTKRDRTDVEYLKEVEADYDIDSDDFDSIANDVSFGPYELNNLKAIEQCLEVLDKVATDEKLVILQKLVNSIIETQLSAPLLRICIVSKYVDTMTYLHAALSDLNITILKIHGGISFSDRQAAIDIFREKGGLLLTTSVGISEGIDLPEVTHVINYDLPADLTVLEQLQGRFDRYGRKTPCKFFILKDESDGG